MEKYDLHMHTMYSSIKDSFMRPKTILRVAKERGLTGIAVTGHNSLSDALMVKKENRDEDFEVIIGSEIKTDMGEVLGYYLNEEIKSRNFFDVLDEIKSQDGISSLAHPFCLTRGFKGGFNDVVRKVNAIECFNPHQTINLINRRTERIADKLNFAKTAGSDAHWVFEIGRAYTVFEGDLRSAIKKRLTKVVGTSKWGLLGHSLCGVRFFRR